MSKETVINGQTAFRAADKGDETALKVVEKYIEYVAEGLVNVINIFQPKKVVIGGGISREGEPFISRVREFVYKYDYNKYLDKYLFLLEFYLYRLKLPIFLDST